MAPPVRHRHGETLYVLASRSSAGSSTHTTAVLVEGVGKAPEDVGIRYLSRSPLACPPAASALQCHARVLSAFLSGRRKAADAARRCLPVRSRRGVMRFRSLPGGWIQTPEGGTTLKSTAWFRISATRPLHESCDNRAPLSPHLGPAAGFFPEEVASNAMVPRLFRTRRYA